MLSLSHLPGSSRHRSLAVTSTAPGRPSGGNSTRKPCTRTRKARMFVEYHPYMLGTHTGCSGVCATYACFKQRWPIIGVSFEAQPGDNRGAPTSNATSLGRKARAAAAGRLGPGPASSSSDVSICTTRWSCRTYSLNDFAYWG